MTKTLAHRPISGVAAIIGAQDRGAALAAIWKVVLSGTEAAFSRGVISGLRAGASFRLGNDLAYKIVKVGIPSKALDPVGDFLGLNKAFIARCVDLDRTTVNRLAAKGEQLPTHAAESMLRLLELDAMAADTFETVDEASAWLRRPHSMLDGDSPLEAAKTSYGAQRVKDILVAIKYGGVA